MTLIKNLDEWISTIHDLESWIECSDGMVLSMFKGYDVDPAKPRDQFEFWGEAGKAVFELLDYHIVQITFRLKEERAVENFANRTSIAHAARTEAVAERHCPWWAVVDGEVRRLCGCDVEGFHQDFPQNKTSSSEHELACQPPRTCDVRRIKELERISMGLLIVTDYEDVDSTAAVLASLNGQMNEKDAAFEKQTAELSSVEANLGELKVEYSSLVADLECASAQRDEAIAKEVEAIAKKAEATQKLEQLNEELRESKDSAIQLQTLADQATREVNESKRQLEAANRNLAKATQDIVQGTNDRSELKKINKQLSDDVARLETELGAYRSTASRPVRAVTVDQAASRKRPRVSAGQQSQQTRLVKLRVNPEQLRASAPPKPQRAHQD